MYKGQPPTPFQAGCPSCRRLFGGVVGFDEHRVNRRCKDPSELGYTEVAGVWRRPEDHAKIQAFNDHVDGKRGRRARESSTK